MKRLLETIRCQDGQLKNLAYHQKRVDRSFARFLPDISPLPLSDIKVPPSAQKGLFKCRLTYTDAVNEIRFSPYQMRPIQSLCLIRADELDYSYKYADRTAINQLFARRGNADDVLIVKNGFITDTSYANVALYDGKKWYTPAKPLLEGTGRARLLDAGIICESAIRVAGLHQFERIRLFNAMIPFEQGISLSMNQVRRAPDFPSV